MLCVRELERVLSFISFSLAEARLPIVNSDVAMGFIVCEFIFRIRLVLLNLYID